MKKSSAKKRNRYDSNQSTLAEKLSGLALNVRKQTSPEAYSKAAYVVTVQANEMPETSYDHDNATRLIDDYSPESQTHALNVF